jgi:hypothetical protein
MSIFDIVTSVIKPSTPPKVGFEDILFAMNNPQYIIISTFSYEEQEFLNKLGTDDFSVEELLNMPIDKKQQVIRAEREKIMEDIEKTKEDIKAEIEEAKSRRRKLYE